MLGGGFLANSPTAKILHSNRYGMKQAQDEPLQLLGHVAGIGSLLEIHSDAKKIKVQQTCSHSLRSYQAHLVALGHGRTDGVKPKKGPSGVGIWNQECESSRHTTSISFHASPQPGASMLSLQ